MSDDFTASPFLRIVRSLVGRRLAYLLWASWHRLTMGKAKRERETARYRSRQELVLVPRLVRLLSENDRFRIIDGGAREMDRDNRWHAFPPEALEFHAFEPDVQEAERLQGSKTERGSVVHFYPAGIWGHSGSLEFEHNNIGGGSSFLHQNRAVTDRWKFQTSSKAEPTSNSFFPARYETLPIISLADWARQNDIAVVDYLKLNVQGGELEILKGAGALLDDVLGVLTEVAFVESYKQRPMFSDIDSFMRSQGFAFFDLLAHHYIGRAVSPVTARHLSVIDPKLGQLVSSYGQLIEGHAIYFRDPIGQPQPKNLTPTQLIKLAALAETFGQIEYAFEVLNWAKAQPGIADQGLSERLQGVIDDAMLAYSAFD